MKRADRGPQYKISTHYVGAGSLAARDGLVYANTAYGVQAVDLSGRERWRAELGSRCLGVAFGKGDEIVATCSDGLYVLDSQGKRQWGTHSKKDVIHDPIPFGEGFVLVTVHSVHLLRDWKGTAWRYDLREALGPSVKSVRLVDVLEMEGQLVLGVVDYDTGIGRVIVLDGDGHKRWMSDAGPLSSLFAAGTAVFIYCLSGYGRFESRMVRPDGKEIWKADFAGTGTFHPDGTISMLVGSNESPTWDDWEYRRLMASGKSEKTVPARGHTTTGPLLASDGSIYFTGYRRPIDPSGSRVDYTSFSALPAALAFGQKTGISLQPPEFNLYFQRVNERCEHQVLWEVPNGLSFSRPVESDGAVFFANGGTLMGFALGG